MEWPAHLPIVGGGGVTMHVSDYDCPEFRDEIHFKEGRM